jgi:Zn-dependent oligopeptidase
MVGSPEQVQEFLHGMKERSKHVFSEDMEILRNVKAYVEGGNGGGGDIEPWDIPFYTTLIKAQRQQLRWKKEEDVDDIG